MTKFRVLITYKKNICKPIKKLLASLIETQVQPICINRLYFELKINLLVKQARIACKQLASYAILLKIVQ